MSIRPRATILAVLLSAGCPGDDPSSSDDVSSQGCIGGGEIGVVLSPLRGTMEPIVDGAELPIAPFSFQAGFGAQVDVRLEGVSLEQTESLEFEIRDEAGALVAQEAYDIGVLVPVCQDDGSLRAFAVSVSFEIALDLFDFDNVPATLSTTLRTQDGPTTQSWDVVLKASGS